MGNSNEQSHKCGNIILKKKNASILGQKRDQLDQELFKGKVGEGTVEDDRWEAEGALCNVKTSIGVQTLQILRACAREQSRAREFEGRGGRRRIASEEDRCQRRE